MTLSLKEILMTFWDILEFSFQEIATVYHQFIGYLSYIRIQLKLQSRTKYLEEMQ